MLFISQPGVWLKARKLVTSSVEGWRIGRIASRGGAVETLTGWELESRGGVVERAVVGGGEVPRERVGGRDGRVDNVVGERRAGDVQT